LFYCSFILSCDIGTLYEYKISGTVGTASISYRNEDGILTNPKEVVLPHRVAFNSKKSTSLYITAASLAPSGNITVEIYVDGALKANNTSSDLYGTATTSYYH
jgi:hypothetical protein